MWSDLTFDPSFKVKQRYPNLKVLITRLLLVLEVCNVKPTYRISWAGNLLVWSDLTFTDASRAQDTRYLVSFSTSLQFGIFGAFGRRHDPAFLQNGGAPIVS